MGQTCRLLLGDCLALLPTLGAGTVDAIVTDPPAGIGFMGKGWDHDKGGRREWIAWLSGIMAECLRVCKPGAHALVWSLPRTSHWTGTALEDAGWEPRDCVYHLFATGFPKSLAIDKELDRIAGAERERLRPLTHPARNGNGTQALGGGWQDEPWETAPATAEAQRWQGWGTALKPAAECWWLVRKPLRATVARNVLEHGTGAINIDGCRIGTAGRPLRIKTGEKPPGTSFDTAHSCAAGATDMGRWPANVTFQHTPLCEMRGTRRVRNSSTDNGARGTGGIWSGVSNKPCGPRYGDHTGTEEVEDWACHPSCPVRILDEQAGERSSGVRQPGVLRANRAGFAGPMPELASDVCYGDSGPASRFFFVAKPSQAERSRGLSGRSHHPTVKPLELMHYLCRLITPPGGAVLDPFMGSGTTGAAALAEGFSFIGMEQDAGYLAVARQRLGLLASLEEEAI